MAHLNPVPLAEVKDDDIRERFEHYRRTRGFTPNSIMTICLLYTSPSPRDRTRSRMPSSA